MLAVQVDRFQYYQNQALKTKKSFALISTMLLITTKSNLKRVKQKCCGFHPEPVRPAAHPDAADDGTVHLPDEEAAQDVAGQDQLGLPDEQPQPGRGADVRPADPPAEPSETGAVPWP